MAHSMSGEHPKIEGFPSVDGAYWYYKRGVVMPSLIFVGTHNGERKIKEGGAIQGYIFPGEFFVGPVSPPFATPDDLATVEFGRHGEEIYPLQANGMAVK